MPAAIVVVRQDALDNATATYLRASNKIRQLFTLLRRWGGCRACSRFIDRTGFIQTKENDRQSQESGKQIPDPAFGNVHACFR